MDVLDPQQVKASLLAQVEAWQVDEEEYEATFEGWVLRECPHLCWSLIDPRQHEIVLSLVPRTKNFGIDPYEYTSVCEVAAGLIVSPAAYLLSQLEQGKIEMEWNGFLLTRKGGWTIIHPEFDEVVLRHVNPGLSDTPQAVAALATSLILDMMQEQKESLNEE